MQETKNASAVSERFKELRSRNTNEHSMGPTGYAVKLAQWEKEDNKLVATGIRNPWDDYPWSRNWMRARSRLEVKDNIAEIKWNKEENKKWLKTSRKGMHM